MARVIRDYARRKKRKGTAQGYGDGIRDPERKAKGGKDIH